MAVVTTDKPQKETTTVQTVRPRLHPHPLLVVAPERNTAVVMTKQLQK
jgi:hypothetical protein